MKTSKRGKAITCIALVTIMVASVMVAMIGGAGAADTGRRYNEIVKQQEAQIVLIGQDLRFVGYWVEAPVIGRVVSGDLENTYKATESGGTYYVYNVNWPTSGAFYVNYVKTGTTVTFDAQLSVEDPKMPLKLKVQDKEVTTIARSIPLNIDIGGINLDDTDVVDLVMIGPNGQITEKNGQTFKDITVDTLKNFNNGNAIDTTGWDVGYYTFQVVTVPEKACNLDYQSVKKVLTLMKGTVQIKADTTEVPEITVVQLAVTGAAGHHITVAPVPVSKNAYFPAGLDDNPRDATTLSFNDVIDDDGTRTYAVEFNDTGTYTIRVTDNNEVDSYDTVDIIVTARDVMFDVPSTVVIGDRFHVKGTSNTGQTVTIAVEDEVVQKLYQIVIDENGEFDEEIDTSSEDAPSSFMIPGSVRMKAYIDYEKQDGQNLPFEISSSVKDDGSTAVLMTRGYLEAELSTPAVAQGDDFTITGTAQGATSVSILIVAPKGYSGSNIEGGEYMYYAATSVTSSDNTFYKKISVGENVDTGRYLIMLLSSGSDGLWGKFGYAKLYNPDDINDQDTSLGQYTLTTKTQGEMLEVVEDETFLSDDQLWIAMENVQKPFVSLNPTAAVGIGEPLEISGVTNREEGYTIVVTVKGPVELTPATTKAENCTFKATIDTTDAKAGTYIVKADDGDGNTDEKLVDIGGKQVEKTVHILNYKDYGIDTDGDGKYDYLAVDVRVNVKTAGKYRIEGSLKDHSTGDHIVSASTDRILDVGVQDVTLKFNGYQIYRHGASVKCDLKDLKVYDKDWNSLDYRSFAYTTSYYSYTYFNVPPADITGSYSNYGIDTDSDGKYNNLAIDVWVNVKEAGHYSVGGWLDEDGNKHITYASMSSHLNEGLQKVTLKFNGYEIYRCGVNAQFVLGYLKLKVRGDEGWNIVDQKWDVHTTSFYYYTGFDKPPADLTGSYSNYGIDADGDGKYDYLAIDVWVNVKENGYYSLDGWLEDCYGHDVTYDRNRTYLEEGLQKLTLEFNGYEIYRQGVSGSFSLGHVKLLDSDWNEVEEKWNVYSTSYYAYTNFDKPPIDLTGAYVDYGVDTDGNGKYDYLAIDVGVNVKEAGTYSVSGNVYDNENDYITSGGAEVELSTGLQKLTLKFDGFKIYRNGVEGPFNLGYVALSDEWNRADYTYDAYVTSYYNYTEFDRKFTGEFNDYGLDTDEDGLYNYLVVEAEINITKAGEYRLSGYLQYYNEEKGYWVNIEYNPNRTYLEAGIQSIALQFDGIEIYNTKYSGSFKVGLSLYESEEENWIDGMEYFTNDYDYIDFQKPPAEFAAGFNDYGLDTNGNSLYEYMIIEKEILVREAGNYRLRGWLKSTSVETIDYDDNNTYLDVGLHSITLQFYGPSIYNSEESDNFEVQLHLYDGDSGERLDSTTNTTSYYSYTDFERPPAEFAAGFNDYGLDTDGNSLYDYLVIEKEIKVREAGNYRLSGRLESSSGKYIDSDSNYTYLDVGVQSVKFQFYGPSIYDSEESGNFDVNMNLYKTDDWSGLDSTMNTTFYYIYTDFERPPAEFAAGFNDYCVDTDEDGIYNYLVVEAEINVTKAGEYKLGGSLKYPALGEGYPWAEIDSDWNRTHLEVGIHKITLQFDGIGIYNTKYSGSFSVLLSLYEAEEGNRIDEMGYFTNDYDYTDFQRPPAEFAAGFNDYGLDTNGNSLYDYLVIKKEIIVREAGNYQLSGWLESPSGDGVDTKYNNTYLDVGLHSITLKFYGPSIYNSGESGNFNVDMNLYGTYSDSTTNTTSYYSYTDFERPPVEFASGFNDYGLDTNGNSLYDYLVIEKEILVRDAGNYSSSGRLESPSGERIDSDYNYTYLDVGLQSIKLQFYGQSIYNKAESGNFDVILNLYDRDNGEGLDSTTNITSYYSYTEFEIPSAEFTGNFNDYGLDTDNDALYNYIVIESEITVKKAGEYNLYGTLRAPSGSWIGSDSNRTYLDVGIPFP